MREAVHMRSGQALHSHFLICYLHLSSSCLLKRVQEHLSSLQDECYKCWLLIWCSVLFLQLHYFTIRGLNAEMRADGSSKPRLLSWLTVPQWHPAAIVTETDCNSTSRHHRPERCFNQKQLSNGFWQCSCRILSAIQEAKNALEPQKTYFPFSKWSVKENVKSMKGGRCVT